MAAISIHRPFKNVRALEADPNGLLFIFPIQQITAGGINEALFPEDARADFAVAMDTSQGQDHPGTGPVATSANLAHVGP